MTDYILVSSLEKVEKVGNRESLLSSLKNLGSFDDDFNGENGIEWCWDETVEHGFESNGDYLCDLVKDIEDDTECVQAFVENWMEQDSSCYSEHFVHCLTDENSNVTCISFSAIRVSY